MTENELFVLCNALVETLMNEQRSASFLILSIDPVQFKYILLQSSNRAPGSKYSYCNTKLLINIRSAYLLFAIICPSHTTCNMRVSAVLFIHHLNSTTSIMYFTYFLSSLFAFVNWLQFN